MKQFSIHKVNKPVMRRQGAGAESANEEGEVSSKQYQTGMVGSEGELDGADYTSGPGGHSGTHEMQGSSLLTAEEQEALQPKEIKVVNPWIHDATHKEYLESVKVSFILRWLFLLLPYLNIIYLWWILNNLKCQGLPARHANVIKKHKNVIREKTFLEEIETAADKDKATQEALKILEKEYEIFNGGSNLPSVKTLTRYDTWEEDKTIEQWIDFCQARPD